MLQSGAAPYISVCFRLEDVRRQSHPISRQSDLSLPLWRIPLYFMKNYWPLNRTLAWFELRRLSPGRRNSFMAVMPNPATSPGLPWTERRRLSQGLKAAESSCHAYLVAFGSIPILWNSALPQNEIVYKINDAGDTDWNLMKLDRNRPPAVSPLVRLINRNQPYEDGIGLRTTLKELLDEFPQYNLATPLGWKSATADMRRRLISVLEPRDVQTIKAVEYPMLGRTDTAEEWLPCYECIEDGDVLMLRRRGKFH